MKKGKAAVKALLYSGEVVGVDFGTHAVKVLRLRFQKRGVTVLAYEEREVWSQLAETKTEEERRAVYAEALAAVVAARQLRGFGAAVSLSGNAVLLRLLKLPRKHRLDPETGIPDDARPLIPFELRDACVDSIAVSASADSPQLELLLAIAEKRVVSESVAVIRKAGLQPVALVNDPLALETAYAYFAPRDAGPVALVNAGASTTSVSIVENGVSRGARVFNIAGNAFTRAIRRDLDVGAEEAQDLKHRFGLTGPAAAGAEPSTAAARVGKALKAPVRDLCVELRRTIDHFADGRPARSPRVQRVLLAGGSARLKGLDAAMAAEIGLPVEIFRPLNGAALRPESARAEHFSPALSVVGGLAATNILFQTRSERMINLVPAATRRAAAVRTLTPARGLLAVLLIVAAAVGTAYEYGRRRAHEAEKQAEALLAEARARAAAVAPRKKEPAKTARAAPSPYAYLRSLTISGLVGDDAGTTYMLTGADAAPYTARGGRLYDAEDAEIPGVSAEVVAEKLIITTPRNERFMIDLPK